MHRIERIFKRTRIRIMIIKNAPKSKEIKRIGNDNID
jgi:hypothetical protein